MPIDSINSIVVPSRRRPLPCVVEAVEGGERVAARRAVRWQAEVGVVGWRMYQTLGAVSARFCVATSMELDDESRERLDTAALDALFDSIDRRLQPGRTTEESSPAAAVSANPFGQAPDTGSSAQEAEPPIRNTVVRLSDEVFQSPDLQPPPGSGPPPAAPRSFTARATQVNVTDGRKQRDGAGKQFWTFVVRTQLEDGQILLSERRYTDFATLHDELAPCLALPAAFPGMPRGLTPD